MWEEARLVSSRSILLVFAETLEDKELEQQFCGQVVVTGADATRLSCMSLNSAGKTLYVCGDLAQTRKEDVARLLALAKRVMVVGQLSFNMHNVESKHGEYKDCSWPVVDVGRVPLLVHGMGVFYRRFFNPSLNYFDAINSEHEFQSLTESTKPGTAHRTGIYLTPVSPSEKGDDGLHFRLLRCSTNLSGPTDNFRSTDCAIVDALNQEAAELFDGAAPLNHVLAQIYWNKVATADHKMTKAKISSHADKTKDMPRSGIMAFCTFYSELERRLERSDSRPFDWTFKQQTSGLTTLQFRLKKCVADRPGCTLQPAFTVCLYPDSVFIMPLTTNRLYTHEIRPSVLGAELLPTRLGYVVRSSLKECFHVNGGTFLKVQPGVGSMKHGQSENETVLVPLEPATQDGVAELRKMYMRENRTDEIVDYGDRFLFSLNAGDYSRPIYNMADEFRRYQLPVESQEDHNPFQKLLDSVQFEGVCKGRQGTVLVRDHPARGTPIVRTTTKYDNPAQRFNNVHARLVQRIRSATSLPCQLNNALIEVYTNAYAKMGFHSDQALDLARDSHIAVFSCYEHPEHATRKLIVESKAGDGSFEIPLEHNSIVVWSLHTNRRFRHKIVLDGCGGAVPENRWLGVTLRTSCTFVQSKAVEGGDGWKCVFEDGSSLRLADDEQRKQFYALRKRENQETTFVYPVLPYTISKSDIIPPA